MLVILLITYTSIAAPSLGNIFGAIQDVVTEKIGQIKDVVEVIAHGHDDKDVDKTSPKVSKS
jgi:hypothetical protein